MEALTAQRVEYRTARQRHCSLCNEQAFSLRINRPRLGKRGRFQKREESMFEKKADLGGAIFVGIVLVVIVPLLTGMCSVASPQESDEVLNTAEAVREMIQGMDIPEEEKQKFLAQVGAVESVQIAAIRLDIDAVLQEFEIALAAWIANDQQVQQYIDLIQRTHDDAKKSFAVGNTRAAERLLGISRALMRNPPQGSMPFMRRAKELDDTLTEQFASARSDNVNISRYVSRYRSTVADAEKNLGRSLQEQYKENGL